MNNNITIPNTASALVVGAGPSGLAALKELKEAGVEAIAVDSRSDFGGVFSPSSAVTYEHLYLTTTNMFMSFSDFPPQDKKVKYWSKQEYYEYLESYVDHFGLLSSIHLETSVVNAKLVEDTWRVVLQFKEGATAVRTFDYMVVATGANHKPHLPTCIFKGFKGEIMHSHQYHSPKQVEGKKVLVIGIGESSADIVKSAAKTAEKVTVWSRRYPNVAPRFLQDAIRDPNYSEDEYLPAQDNQTRLPGEFLEAVLTSRIVQNMPLAAWAIAIQKGLFADLKAAHGSKSPSGLMSDWCLNAYKTDFFSGDHSSVPTKTMMMCTTAANREMDLVVAPRIRCDSNTVVFEEPSYYGLEETETPQDLPMDIDVIVACTGFKVCFDWLEAPNLCTNPRYWFKHCFPTTGGVEGKLAFLGYARPHQGGIPQCAEMLARYVAQIASKNATLPSNYKNLALSEGTCEEDGFHLSKHVLPLVDYPAFMMSVSKLTGCEPAVPRTVSGMVRYWTFPLWSCNFRTQGVGAKPEAYEAVMEKFGTFDSLAPMPLLAFQVVLTLFMPILNFLSFLFGKILGEHTRVGLPIAFKFRMSKMHFMSGNAVRLSDFGAPLLAQWFAAVAIIFHGVASLFHTKVASDDDTFMAVNKDLQQHLLSPMERKQARARKAVSKSMPNV